MKKLLFTYCTILSFIPTIIAQSYSCSCIHLHTPKLEQTAMFFSPDVIKKDNIQSAVITFHQKDTVENDTTRKSIINGERKQSFLFNNDGYVRSLQDFTNPRISSQTDFKRNTAHQIIQKTTFFLDDLGNPRVNSPKITVDIAYPNEWTTKTKNRDFRGNIVEDSISNYAILKRDRLNREKSTYYHSFYVGTRYIESTSYKYDASAFKGTSKRTNADGKTYKLSETQYNANWQPIIQTFFNSYSTGPSYRETSKYNDEQQLTYRKIERIGIAGTECPDHKNYELFYEYAPNNLLKRITYTYKNVSCILNLKYE